jgi:cellulose synthase/poly-beta-1,6-N-acetylglucosamine synthase-like glycosyltransferase
MVTSIEIASWLGALAVLPVWLYLGMLTALSWRRRPPADVPARRLVCVVPAHDEERGIAATVQSLLDADYPPELRRVLVVADNCSDRTAALARRAGAEVLERRDDLRHGKGFALEAAFGRVLAEPVVAGGAQGVIVVDADTVVAPNLWRCVSSHLAAGALAMQVANTVRNPEAGWRPRLQAIAMAMINGVRSLGRERLRMSVGLRGTGMAFARETLERVPHEVYGVVEDVEYGVRLGLEGIRVAFVPETWIASDAPVTGKTALSQRRRWEGGRAALVRTLFPRVARAAWRQRSGMLADLAVDVLVPPLSYPALIVVAGGALEGAHVWLTGAPSSAWPLWALSTVLLVAHVLRGVAVSGTGWLGLATLVAAPAYVAWKIAVARPWKGTHRWVRTGRER